MSEETNNETVETPAAVEETVMPPISEKVTAENDASDDAILDDIFGTDEDSPAETVAETTQKETTAEVVDETEGNADSETRTEPSNLEGYDKAIAALQRDGVPRSVIDQMAEDNPQNLVDWGLKRAKNQSDVDSYSAKLKELEDGKSSDAETATSESESKEQVQSNDQPFDLEQITQYENEISDIFGEEAAKSIMSPMRAFMQETQTTIQQQQEFINNMIAEQENRQINESRERLGERFPKLRDDNDFGTVVEQMTKLVQVGEYDNFDDLMTDAYRMKFADDMANRAQAQQKNKIRDAGQPTTSFVSSTPASSKSGDEREDAVLDALLNGGGYDVVAFFAAKVWILLSRVVKQLTTPFCLTNLQRMTTTNQMQLSRGKTHKSLVI
jgi:hypothetical protein